MCSFALILVQGDNSIWFLAEERASSSCEAELSSATCCWIVLLSEDRVWAGGRDAAVCWDASERWGQGTGSERPRAPGDTTRSFVLINFPIAGSDLWLIDTVGPLPPSGHSHRLLVRFLKSDAWWYRESPRLHSASRPLSCESRWSQVQPSSWRQRRLSRFLFTSWLVCECLATSAIPPHPPDEPDPRAKSCLLGFCQLQHFSEFQFLLLQRDRYPFQLVASKLWTGLPRSSRYSTLCFRRRVVFYLIPCVSGLSSTESVLILSLWLRRPSRQNLWKVVDKQTLLAFLITSLASHQNQNSIEKLFGSQIIHRNKIIVSSLWPQSCSRLPSPHRTLGQIH